MTNKGESSIGRAYGFFYCDAQKEEIEAELPIISEMVQVPSQLELSLTEGLDNIKSGEKLTAIAQKAKREGMNYILQATNPSGTNKETADEIAAILNQAYQSPLYEPNAPFKGAIVYEEKGEYVFRD